MIFNGRSLQDLSITDFETLAKKQVPEGPDLEYKLTAYRGTASEIREMLRDVSALANLEGGYLIMGMKQDTTDRAEEIVPIENVLQLTQAIRQACLDGISERIDGLEVKCYETSTDMGIIVIRIPKSDNRPHMVSKEHRTDFFKRYDTDKREMTIDEIRSLVIANPLNTRLVELELLASGKLIKPSRGTKRQNPPYVRIYTEKSVDQFLQKYFVCDKFPQNLVIVSPFISDLSSEQINLTDIVSKINHDKTYTYVITRPPREVYQKDSLEVLSRSPYIEVRYNEDIHAKLFICWCRKDVDESFALFGSGNLTSGGIRRNLELGMMIYSQDQGRLIINDLYEWSTVGLRSKSRLTQKLVRTIN